MNSCADRLRALREDSDMRQTDVAKHLGLLQQHYSKFETGEISVPMKHIMALADLFDVSTDYLLCRVNNPQGVKVLDVPFTDTCTTGQFLEKATALNEDGRKAAIEFVDFQKNKK